MNARWAGLVVVLVGCGGGGDPAVPDAAVHDAVQLDAAAPDAAAACDPLAQTGCGAASKCTWVTIDSTTGLGELACVNPGAVEAGQPCRRGADGQTTGYDNCAAGLLCVDILGGAVCEPICAVDASTCAEPTTCVAHPGVFAGTATALGVCDGPTGPCDPVAQTGCAAGQRCTWLQTAPGVGTTACAADGSAELASACTRGPDGATTGIDTCTAGTVCAGGICEAICTLTPDSCGGPTSCTGYSGLFGGSADGIGACAADCDPVTQRRLWDNAPACGSADPQVPNHGCYGRAGRDFTCSVVPPEILAAPTSYDQGDVALGPSGNPFLNGCRPGFESLIRAGGSAPDSPLTCVAMCAPGPTSIEEPGNAAGVPGSLHTCADRGVTAAGTECRYLWLLESAEPPLHPDGVGFCWNPDDYTDVPRCSTTATADQAGLACAPY